MTRIKTSFTIGQLARQAQIPQTTVRFYERIGLLLPDSRSPGNYRLYGPASLGRLRFIRSAQAIGFTLDDVKTLLGDSTSGQPPACRDVQKLIEDRLAQIAARLRDLRQVQRALESSLRRCKQQGQAQCHVVETLSN